MAEVTQTRSRKKQKRSVPSAQVHIQASFNNTIVTFTDTKGQVLTTASAGTAGFKGARKSTAYAAQLASEKAAESAKEFAVKSVEVLVNGIGLGREAAIRALQNTNIYVTSIKDVTGIPHNGCRPRKIRKP